MTGVMGRYRSSTACRGYRLGMSAVAHHAVVAPAGTAADHPLVVGRAAVLLDVLMGLSVLAGLVWVLALVDDARVQPWWALGYLAVVVAMTALWAARRVVEQRSGQPARRLVTVFAALAVLGLFVADGQGAWPLFLMALLAVVSASTPRAGVLLVATTLVVQLAVFVAVDRGPGETAWQLGGSAFVFGFGLVLAWVVAEHAAQSARIARLLEEVRQARSAEVELVLADERARSARDLHDGLGHRLSVMSMSLAFATRMRDRDPDRAWEQVGAAATQAGEALTTMRRWVRALSPVRVEGASTAVALDAIAESFRGTGLEVRVRAPDAGRQPDRPATLFLHRFVQEGLTNALRHSAAASVDVECRAAEGGWVIGVRDDGSHGPTDRPAPPYGFGLRSLAERAADLGGSVSTAWSASGFELSAHLPS